eukprot:12172556-Ditylum_brightwellii.AAC.1
MEGRALLRHSFIVFGVMRRSISSSTRGTTRGSRFSSKWEARMARGIPWTCLSLRKGNTLGAEHLRLRRHLTWSKSFGIAPPVLH